VRNKGVCASQQNSNVLGPNSWASPDGGPVTSVCGSAMSFLETDDVCLESAKLMEELATLKVVTKPTTIERHNG
jgi:hypothetical protein